MIYCFDLDGTLCTNTEGSYEKARPFTERIQKVNQLFDEGHHIIVDTARGATTGIDWLELTTNQLKEWGLKYHELRVGKKINYDYIIDDKAINHNDFFENENIGNLIDNYIEKKVISYLNNDKFPKYDKIYTDTFSELIDKLCIVHIRYWYLEDAMASTQDDQELLQLRRKSESLFKEKRPMLVHGIDKYISLLVNNEINSNPVNYKHYKNWPQ
jgi:hypothetical protein